MLAGGRVRVEVGERFYPIFGLFGHGRRRAALRRVGAREQQHDPCKGKTARSRPPNLACSLACATRRGHAHSPRPIKPKTRPLEIFLLAMEHLADYNVLRYSPPWRDILDRRMP